MEKLDVATGSMLLGLQGPQHHIFCISEQECPGEVNLWGHLNKSLTKKYSQITGNSIVAFDIMLRLTT